MFVKMSGPDASSALPASGGNKDCKDKSPEEQDSWRGASVLIKESRAGKQHTGKKRKNNSHRF